MSHLGRPGSGRNPCQRTASQVRESPEEPGVECPGVSSQPAKVLFCPGISLLRLALAARVGLMNERALADNNAD